ncbi:hypothetical protein TruAng_009119 [Truncatella angustata]|nr:hypothetical protein TruAng_009119 [Truncatella angustata]
MASHEEDHLPEETQGYKLSQPKQSLAEYQNMGSTVHLSLAYEEVSHQYAVETKEAWPGDDVKGLNDGREAREYDIHSLVVVVLYSHKGLSDQATHFCASGLDACSDGGL